MIEENNVINFETYDYYIHSIRRIGYEKFFEKIKDKKIVDKNMIIDNCGIYYINGLLNGDWGRSIVVNYSEEQLEFIKSKCLSNYFKEGIKELFSGVMVREIENILNSDKDINQMEENEIKILKDAIFNYYNNNENIKSNVSKYFLSYLYKLDGNGVISFIKNNIDSEDIVRRILLTSGLSDRASYYSGRGVMYCDLNENNLATIFFKLLRLDENYALNFIEMVCDMKTLGATEFINSFINLGINKFEYDTKNIEESNVSIDDVYDLARNMVALGSLFSSFYKKDDDYQISESSLMKVAFLKKIKNDLKKYDVKQIDKMYEKIYEQEFIYYDQEDYWDYRRYR